MSLVHARPPAGNAHRWAAMNAIAQVYVEQLEYWQW
jgi:hypothetical protein